VLGEAPTGTPSTANATLDRRNGSQPRATEEGKGEERMDLEVPVKGTQNNGKKRSKGRERKGDRFYSPEGFPCLYR